MGAIVFPIASTSESRRVRKVPLSASVPAGSAKRTQLFSIRRHASAVRLPRLPSGVHLQAASPRSRRVHALEQFEEATACTPRRRNRLRESRRLRTEKSVANLREITVKRRLSASAV